MRSMMVATELYELYGRHPSLRGLYITNEVDNREWQTPETLQWLIHYLLAPVTAHIKALDPTLMTSLAPYHIKECAPPATWGEQWNTTLAALPHLDTLIPQDGMGHTHLQNDSLADVVAYLRAMRTAADAHGVAMWVDLELFTARFVHKRRAGATPANVSRVITALTNEAPLADRFLGFEFHQYMSPYNDKLPPSNPLYTGYRSYLRHAGPEPTTARIASSTRQSAMAAALSPQTSQWWRHVAVRLSNFMGWLDVGDVAGKQAFIDEWSPDLLDWYGGGGEFNAQWMVYSSTAVGVVNTSVSYTHLTLPTTPYV